MISVYDVERLNSSFNYFYLILPIIQDFLWKNGERIQQFNAYKLLWLCINKKSKNALAILIKKLLVFDENLYKIFNSFCSSAIVTKWPANNSRSASNCSKKYLASDNFCKRYDFQYFLEFHELFYQKCSEKHKIFRLMFRSDKVYKI